MGIVKKKERERMSNIILKDIWERLIELSERAMDDNLNGAYRFAFEIGLRADIEDSLKKLKQETV